ncbi:MAG: hypothetical protein J6328_03935 [Bacilli bacterium]|nr:hypothetical protein [Bacilli bacterium]
MNILGTNAMWEVNNFGDAVVISILCIAAVFTVLLVIALLMGLLNKMDFLDEKTPTKLSDGTIVDKEMMAAILVATIDYRKERKEDIKVISCKEIKD